MMRNFLLLVFSSLSVIAFAQDSLENKWLNEVVVTGQYEPQSAHKSVYQVRTITSDVIMAKSASTLQEVLNTQLNFRFSQDAALGVSTVTMNGLSGQNVKVLIDGIPVIGRQGTTNATDLNQININTIERIEIIEGPMSVMYGADALAGVINIITKKAADEKLSLNLKLQEETVGSEYSIDEGVHNQNISLRYNWEKFYAGIDAGHNYFGGWQGDSVGRAKQWNPKTQWLGAGLFGYKTEGLDIYYRLDALDETIIRYGDFINGSAFDQRFLTKRFINQVQANIKLSDRSSFNGAISYTDYERRTQSVNVDEATGRETLSLGGSQQDRTPYSGLTVRGTFQIKLGNKLSIQPGYDVNVESGSGGRLKEGTHAISDYAGFLSLEYKPIEKISIRPGVRFSQNSQYETPPVIPSLNTKFIINSDMDFRISYGRGFRAPSLRELYFDFFDASHSISGNPDLTPEISNSLNATYTWKTFKKNKMYWTNTLGGFYNSIDDMIGYGFLPGNQTITTYINVDKYQSTGGTFTSSLIFRELDVTGGFSYTGWYNDFNEEDQQSPEFTWSPEVTTNVTYKFSKPGITVNAFYKFTGKLNRYNLENGEVVLGTTDSYNWLDMSIQKTFFKQLDVALGARNIGNVTNISNSSSGGTHTPGGSASVSYGRSYFLTLNYHFTK